MPGVEAVGLQVSAALGSLTVLMSLQTSAASTFPATAAKSRLLLSLWGEGSKITSAAFTLEPGRHDHVCCFHFRARAAKSRALLSAAWASGQVLLALNPAISRRDYIS